MSTDLIKQLANNFIGAVEKTGLELAFDEKSIEMIDIIIENSGVDPEAEPDKLNQLVEFIGSFLGEAMSQTLGMNWGQRKEDGQWVLTVQTKNGDTITANPFNKVYKRFINGKEDSIGYYFAMIKKTIAGELQV